MVNDGAHANGSQFAVLFDEAHYLDGYNNVVGELVQGEEVLASIEGTCNRQGKVAAEWKVSGTGML